MRTPAENIARSSELQHEFNAAGLAFLKTEVDTSMTFAQLALGAGTDSEKKTRNQANAREGYNTILRLSERFPPKMMSEPDRQQFELRLKELRAALEGLGEQL
jgi:hypothetical protein